MSEAMGKKIREDREELRQVSEGIIASLDRANLGAHLEGVTRSTELERADFEVGDAEAIEEQLLGGTLEGGKNQVITAEAFWWGYHFVVPESAIADAMRFADAELGLALEGSAAVTIAWLRRHDAARPVVLILSGRNVDPERLAELRARG
ncbi:MAG TPA: hypothetical protein RMH99_28940 [Sandaracinaceae bacterium LLY-WYZ-13_1]|nr:hypothetical protein [Sandaracinaceae bacterium LLY-WYZ-13_1]